MYLRGLAHPSLFALVDVVVPSPEISFSYPSVVSLLSLSFIVCESVLLCLLNSAIYDDIVLTLEMFRILSATVPPLRTLPDIDESLFHKQTIDKLHKLKR